MEILLDVFSILNVLRHCSGYLLLVFIVYLCVRDFLRYWIGEING